MKLKMFLPNGIFLLVLLWIQAPSLAQTAGDSNQLNLKIGDKVPDIPISKFLDNKGPKNISAYKDKLLILDFMATTCGNCILALPKMEKLQEKYKDSMRILPITYEDRTLVKAFFGKNRLVKNLKLPIVIEDKELARHFKHKLLSHVVWVYKGKVVAISGSEYVDEKQIEAILNGETIDIPLKDDFPQFNYEKPIFASGAGDYQCYSAVGKHIEDAKTRYGAEKDSISQLIRDYMVNVPVIQAYLYATMQFRKLPYMKNNRILLEGLAREDYIFDKTGDQYKAEWDQAHSISYESLLPDSLDKGERMKRIIADLDNKLGLKGKIELRNIKCWIVKKGTGKTGKPTEGGSRQPFSDFVFLLDLNRDIPPIVDESGFEGEILLDSWTDFGSLKDMLRANGLDLEEGEREAEVFVLSRQ